MTANKQFLVHTERGFLFLNLNFVFFLLLFLHSFKETKLSMVNHMTANNQFLVETEGFCVFFLVSFLSFSFLSLLFLSQYIHTPLLLLSLPSSPSLSLSLSLLRTEMWTRNSRTMVLGCPTDWRIDL